MNPAKVGLQASSSSAEATAMTTDREEGGGGESAPDFYPPFPSFFLLPLPFYLMADFRFRPSWFFLSFPDRPTWGCNAILFPGGFLLVNAVEKVSKRWENKEWGKKVEIKTRDRFTGILEPCSFDIVDCNKTALHAILIRRPVSLEFFACRLLNLHTTFMRGTAASLEEDLNALLPRNFRAGPTRLFFRRVPFVHCFSSSSLSASVQEEEDYGQLSFIHSHANYKFPLACALISPII